MTRFADPNKFARLSVGECECPGKPHTEGDWMELRTELGAQDMNSLATGNSIDALEVLLLRWNFQDADGTEAPIDRDHIERLYADVFPTLNKWMASHIRYATLPNGSAASSPTTTQGAASRTRTPKTVS